MLEKNDLQREQIYIMDKNEFPVNGGVFNNKQRYGSFVEGITKSSDVPLAGMLYIIMRNGKMLDFAPYLEREKILTYAKNRI